MNTALAQLVEAELERPEIKSAEVTDDSLVLDLQDGRTIIAPILWYPRLAAATAHERQQYQIRRSVISWPDLDEEVSVRGILLGRKSGESSESLQRWLSQRNSALSTT